MKFNVFRFYLVCSKPCLGCTKYPNNCTSCSNEYKLVVTPSTNNTCLPKCNPLCSKCLDEKLCFECSNKIHFLEKISVSEAVCREKKRVSASLVALNNPKLFQLKFSDFWPELFQNFANKTTLVISKLDNANYSCEIAKDNSDEKAFNIRCAYITNVTSDSILSLSITNYPPNDHNTSQFIIGESKYEINLGSYVFCGEGSSWREGKKQFIHFPLIFFF